MTARIRDTGTLGKAVAVLEAVAMSHEALRFRDLAARIDQPRGTLHRQTSNLIEEGLLEINPDQTYALGLRFLKFAAGTWAKNTFRALAEPHIRALHELTGETVHIGVLKGCEVIYVDKVESRQTVRMHSQIGNSSPCYCTGVGKAALSVIPEAEAMARLSTLSFKKFTGTTLDSPQAVIAELQEINATGIAYDREEHEPGIHCVAAPVYSQDLSIVGGISVTVPVYRGSLSKLESWADDIHKAAQTIMQELPVKLGPGA